MNENKKNDFYFPVLLWQTVLSALAVLMIFLVSSSEEFKEEFSSFLSSDRQGQEIQTAILAAKNYYFGESEETDLPQQDTFVLPAGGDDLTLYEATENTSFAPLYATAKIIPPIENGRYTSLFGYRINPVSQEFSFHTGIDIAADEGTNIRATFSGKVTKIGEDSRSGKYIYLTHDDGLVTFYCHCSEILADEGAVIRQGETIALVGSTGWSTGPHLHFEVRKNNIRYNPLYLLENDC